MTCNHVEDHLSLAASSSFGRRETRYIQAPHSSAPSQEAPSQQAGAPEAHRRLSSFFFLSQTQRGMKNQKNSPTKEKSPAAESNRPPQNAALRYCTRPIGFIATGAAGS